jgi:hypothetical protein
MHGPFHLEAPLVDGLTEVRLDAALSCWPRRGRCRAAIAGRYMSVPTHALVCRLYHAYGGARRRCHRQGPPMRNPNLHHLLGSVTGSSGMPPGAAAQSTRPPTGCRQQVKVRRCEPTAAGVYPGRHRSRLVCSSMAYSTHTVIIDGPELTTSGHAAKRGRRWRGLRPSIPWLP